MCRQSFLRFESVFRDRARVFDSIVYRASWVFGYTAVHSVHACQHLCGQERRCAGFVFLNYSSGRLCIGVNDIGSSDGMDVRDAVARLPVPLAVGKDELVTHMPVCMRRIEQRRRRAPS